MIVVPTDSAHVWRPSTGPDGRLRVAILGCSGSIGTQALDVCRQHGDKVCVTALSVARSTEALVAAAREFKVRHAGVSDPTHAHDTVLQDLPTGCDLRVGADAAAGLAALDDVDCVVVAVVGFAALRCTFEALEAGKRIGYANKESIVCAGDLLMPMATPGQIVPVDSEHSAIFQCLCGSGARDLRRIWLTCSGGPFFGLTRKELASVTAADALRHPTWQMGAKITIDSATLANKGLEVLEARQLFDVGVDDVRVLVQKQSRIHSMVEYADGSVVAQLGPSDMRIPIQYALSYPDRWEAPCEPVDWTHEAPVTFGEADEEAFGCLALAKQAGRAGGTMPCVFNAANEVANQAFREGRCGFLDVERVIGRVMDRTAPQPVTSIEQACSVDAEARVRATEALREVVA